jgi:predicted GTPase
MMGRMSKEEKEEMMGKMIDKFFSDMTVDDRKKMMAEMMPKMMEGINMMEMMPQMMMSMMGGGEGEGGMMGMMSKMMGGGKETEMPMMPQMMMEMMPQCLRMMLPNVVKEKRIDFVSEMIDTLMEQGCVGMSEEEKQDFTAKVAEKVKA